MLVWNNPTEPATMSIETTLDLYQITSVRPVNTMRTTRIVKLDTAMGPQCMNRFTKVHLNTLRKRVSFFVPPILGMDIDSTTTMDPLGHLWGDNVLHCRFLQEIPKLQSPDPGKIYGNLGKSVFLLNKSCTTWVGAIQIIYTPED